ncbi:hypothetical protein OAM67_01510 [bacterium]|nr:hypothetical protein [bacterium]
MKVCNKVVTVLVPGSGRRIGKFNYDPVHASWNLQKLRAAICQRIAQQKMQQFAGLVTLYWTERTTTTTTKKKKKTAKTIVHYLRTTDDWIEFYVYGNNVVFAKPATEQEKMIARNAAFVATNMQPVGDVLRQSLANSKARTFKKAAQVSTMFSEVRAVVVYNRPLCLKEARRLSLFAGISSDELEGFFDEAIALARVVLKQAVLDELK